MRLKKYKLLCAGAVFSLLASVQMVQASPWAAVGDMQLRNDVEILARHGVISGPVNTWPISWKQISRNLSRTSEMELPPYVRLAVMRVKGKIPGKLRTAVRIQATNNPAIVRGFATTARNDLDADATLEYNNSDSGTTIHIQGGYRKGNGEDYAHLDGSYLSQDMGNWSAYAGAFDRWWGSGRESTLIMSNNARPMPSVGLRRIEPKAFETKWLSWMGPWQWDMFVAKMEKERFVSEPIFMGMRLSFEPIENFEVGLSRTFMLCGEDRPCNLNSWTKALISIGDLDNPETADGVLNEPGNQLASIDLSYSMNVGERTQLKIYVEGTAEDFQYFIPFKYAKLLGLSFYGPYGDDGASWRVTTEFSDTVPRHGWLIGSQQLNIFYEHHKYKTGYRYLGRSVGHSLDSDSRIFTISAQYKTAQDWTYVAKYHRAKISVDGEDKNKKSIPKRDVDVFDFSLQGNLKFGNILIGVKHTFETIDELGIDGSFTTGSLTWTLKY